MDLPITLNLDRLLPEFIVAGTGFAAIITELLLPPGRRAVATGWTSVCGLGVALLVLLGATPMGHALLVEGPARVGGGIETVLITGWASDAFSVYVRAVTLVTGILLFLLSMRYLRRLDRGHGELSALLLFCLLGVMLVAGVQDMLSLFISLELVTILAYILVAFRRNDVRSTEAGLKYLVIGAVSTALLLLGIAFVYGHTGSLSFDVLERTLHGGGISVFLALGLALVVIGLFFKIGAVPFHVWLPDVYQGSPTPVTAFLATASKGAGIVLLLRFGSVAFGGSGGGISWVVLLGAVAVVTLLLGSLGAIPQRDIKRMLGYSGISHAAYLIMGFAALAASLKSGSAEPLAPRAILFYFLAYSVTGLTAFAVIVLVSAASTRQLGPGSHGGAAYRGLHRRSPFLALAMLFALLSMAGVPPMSGFFAKLLILDALVKEGLFGLAIMGAIAVIIGLYFYFLWLKEMYFREPDPVFEGTTISVPWTSRLVLLIGMVAMVAMGVFMGPFLEWAEAAAASL